MLWLCITRMFQETFHNSPAPLAEDWWGSNSLQSRKLPRTEAAGESARCHRGFFASVLESPSSFSCCRAGYTLPGVPTTVGQGIPLPEAVVAIHSFVTPAVPFLLGTSHSSIVHLHPFPYSVFLQQGQSDRHLQIQKGCNQIVRSSPCSSVVNTCA